MIAAYGLLILFVLLIASSIWWVSKYHTPAFGIKTENQMISFIIIFVAFPFTGLLLAMFSMWDKGARMDYMRNIKEWRTRNFFQIILDLVERGQLQESISYHNSMSQGEMKSHLFAVLVREFSKSNDPELNEIAKKKLKEVRSTYDPAKVKF
ncbi:MAG: hypothetical protein WC333_02185 [Dehalococcoidia bacterium]|jgi:hypothetical protein